MAAFEKEVIKNAIAAYVASGKDYIAPTVYFLVSTRSFVERRNNFFTGSA